MNRKRKITLDNGQTFLSYKKLQLEALLSMPIETPLQPSRTETPEPFFAETPSLATPEPEVFYPQTPEKEIYVKIEQDLPALIPYFIYADMPALIPLEN